MLFIVFFIPPSIDQYRLGFEALSTTFDEFSLIGIIIFDRTRGCLFIGSFSNRRINMTRIIIMVDALYFAHNIVHSVDIFINDNARWNSNQPLCPSSSFSPLEHVSKTMRNSFYKCYYINFIIFTNIFHCMSPQVYDETLWNGKYEWK